ncbi:MAG: PQQ-binding-like beta-propeller repeat protein [bacterium]
MSLVKIVKTVAHLAERQIKLKASHYLKKKCLVFVLPCLFAFLFGFSENVEIHAAQGNASIMFIENVGQFDPQVRFKVQGENGTIFLTDDAIWISLLQPTAAEEEKSQLEVHHLFENTDSEDFFGGINLRVSFVADNSNTKMEGIAQQTTSVSYFKGNDPTNWHTNVPVWGGVRYIDIYPGVNLEITGEYGRWTWRMVSSDPNTLLNVRLQVEGAKVLGLEEDHLTLMTSYRNFNLPLIQTASSITKSISLIGNEVSAPFIVSSSQRNDLNESLVDNQLNLVYSTFLGGSSSDYGQAIAVDNSGAAYLVARTYSSNFPTTVGAFKPGFLGGVYDVVVSKLSPNGDALIYSTFLGGSDFDYLGDIEVDDSGSAYVGGWTWSGNFPTTSGAFDTHHDGVEPYVTKLSPDGGSLIYSTFLGGDASGILEGIAVDDNGSAYVTGLTFSANFPITTGAFQTVLAGGAEAFVAKLKADGSDLVYCTFLGGSGDELGTYGGNIAVDNQGAAHVAATTRSQDFPTTSGAFQPAFANGEMGYISKVNATGSDLIYSTYLGGANGHDEIYGLDVDNNGAVYVVGRTSEIRRGDPIGFPITDGAFDQSFNGRVDAFVTKLNPGGSGLVYSTFLGGNHIEQAYGITVLENGKVFVTGGTSSPDFPVSTDAFDSEHNGSSDVFVASLSADGGNLEYSSYLGGSSLERGFDIVNDEDGSLFITGDSHSSDFPVTSDAFDDSHNGSADAFVTKLGFGITEPTTQAPWPMYQHDAQHTGRSLFKGPDQPEIKWTFDTGTERWLISSVVGADGTIHITSYDNYLYAINPDGTLKWKFLAGSSNDSSPAIGADGTIYIGSSSYYDKKFYALNPDGSVIWIYIPDLGITHPPAIGTDGTIYLTTSVSLHAINPDGSGKWVSTLGTGGSDLITTPPTIGLDGTIYVGKQDKDLYAINPDGTEKWQFTIDSEYHGFKSPQAIGADGTVYAGSDYGRLYAITPTGNLKWEFSTVAHSGIFTSPAIGLDRAIYLGHYNGRIYAINPDGSLKWEFYSGDYQDRFSTVAIDREGVLYVLSEKDNSLYALRNNQTIKWKIQIDSPLSVGTIGRHSPVIGYNETIYLGSTDGKLYAVGRKSQLPKLAIPYVVPIALQIKDWGESVTYTITVRDDNNSPVSGARIFVIDQLQSLEDWLPSTTDENGQITYTTTVPEGIANDTYYVTFDAVKTDYQDSQRAPRRIHVNHRIDYATLKGTVVEEGSNKPIEDAFVRINPLVIGGHTKTDQQGRWELQIPGGRGYELRIIADGYKSVEETGLKLYNGTTTTLIHRLIPELPEYDDYRIVPVASAPNPDVLEIPEGGIGYAWFVLEGRNVHNQWLPVSNTLVEARDAQGYIIESRSNWLNYPFLSDPFNIQQSGVFPIKIPADMIMNGKSGSEETITVYNANGQNLSAGSQASILARVVPYKYTASWGYRIYGKLGLGVTGGIITATAFAGGGSGATIEIDFTGLNPNPAWSKLKILRRDDIFIGAEIELGPPDLIEASFAPGLDASAEGVWTFPYQREYTFDLANLQGLEAVIAFYLFYAPTITYASAVGPAGGQIAVAFLSWLVEDIITNSSPEALAIVRTADEVGLDIGANVSVGVQLGIDFSNDLELSMSASFGDAHFGGSLKKSVDNQRQVRLYNFGSLDLQSMVGPQMLFESGIESKYFYPWRMRHNLRPQRFGVGFELLVNWRQSDWYRVRFSSSLESNWTPFNLFNLPGEKQQYKHYLQIDDETVRNKLFNVAKIPSQAWNIGKTGVSVFLDNADWKEDLLHFLTAIYNDQNARLPVKVGYGLDVTDKTDFGLDIDLEFPLPVAPPLVIKVGGGIEAAITREYHLGEGFWSLGVPYFQTVMPSPPNNQTGFLQVMHALWNQVISGNVWEELKNVIVSYLKDTELNNSTGISLQIASSQKVVLNKRGSSIVLRSGSIPSGLDSTYCRYYEWAAKPTNPTLTTKQRMAIQKYNHRLRQLREKVVGLHYGIGGFFSLEPNGVQFQDSTLLTIVYSDSEIVGLDEKKLAVFGEDSLGTWHYLASSTYPDSNKVAAWIPDFRTYTLAPSMPQGQFGMSANPDSLPADGISTAAITSELLYNNDGSLIPDGSLFTVLASRGKILTSDANPFISGIQVPVTAGILKFSVQADSLSFPVELTAHSVEGFAQGQMTLNLYDVTIPQPPTLLSVEPSERGIKVKWQVTGEVDLAGYRLWFDTDSSGAPYSGSASVFGENSPVSVGIIDEYTLTGLSVDSTYYISVTAFDVSGNESGYSNELKLVTSLEFPRIINLPKQFSLHQNYPNPFNPITTIQYTLPEISQVEIRIFNALGQTVTRLVTQSQEPGVYKVDWNGTNDHGVLVGSGIYFYRIQAGDFVKVRKMILIR